VCDNNQVVEAIKVCDEFEDCEDGSDEAKVYCDATQCNNLFSLFCKNQCPQGLGKLLDYSFSIFTILIPSCSQLCHRIIVISRFLPDPQKDIQLFKCNKFRRSKVSSTISTRGELQMLD